MIKVRFDTRWLALLLLLFNGCASVDPVVKVGLVAPFEGADRAIGYDVIYSARLAVREINAQGGIGGYRVALVALDDGGDPRLAAETAVALTVDPAVVAVIGHWQDDTTAAAAPVYEEAGLLFLPMSEGDVIEPELLSASFLEAYAAVTPFEEVAGAYAGPTHEAFMQVWGLMETAVSTHGELTRDSLSRN